MSRRKIVRKKDGDASQTKKLSPRKWAATKSVTSAEILWQHIVADEEAKYITVEQSNDDKN